MKTAIIVAFGFLSSFVPSTAYTQSDKSSPAIALVGGTLIDVSNSGHSTRDVRNAVVVLRDGKIEAAGPAASVKIPKDARTLDYTGTYILPGLVDGFAGLNSQAQANAELYMGSDHDRQQPRRSPRYLETGRSSQSACLSDR